MKRENLADSSFNTTWSKQLKLQHPIKYYLLIKNFIEELIFRKLLINYETLTDSRVCWL